MTMKSPHTGLHQDTKQEKKERVQCWRQIEKKPSLFGEVR